MKKIIVPIVCLISILLVLLNINRISSMLANILTNSNHATIKVTNDYYKENNYAYVSNMKNFTPYGKQDLINIIYTMINSGIENFTFYCPKEYKDCMSDVDDFTKKDNDTVTHINNFVHPFNSVVNINTTIYDSGEINLKAEYLYSKEEIEKINSEVDKILKSINKEVNLDAKIKEIKNNKDTSLEDKQKLILEEEKNYIKAVHDYIINHTKYDLKNNKEDKGYLAYGALFNHLATCNGYTDLMAIFLTKMGYDNLKIATTGVEENQSGHVWNAVYIGNNWYHLDLTWDDPVDEKEDHLYHKYCIVTTDQLEEADKNITSKEHTFDKSIYFELKNTSKN